MWWCSLRSLCTALTSQRMPACTAWSSCSRMTCLLVRGDLHVLPQALALQSLLWQHSLGTIHLTAVLPRKNGSLPTQLPVKVTLQHTESRGPMSLPAP